MKQALVLLAEGFEEMEAVIVIDVLRRAEVKVTSASLKELAVRGGHGIVVQADTLLDQVDATDFDIVILPGGGKGSENLRDDARVQQLLSAQHAKGRYIGAICAAPMALEAAGVLNGRAATSYPGVAIPSAHYKTERVVIDDHIVTSRSAGTAMEFSLALVELLVGMSAASKLRETMLVSTQKP
jgi:4-methyl-5(b-hydroxyethyl)-thiazole monophosphate biosynthesis